MDNNQQAFYDRIDALQERLTLRMIALLRTAGHTDGEIILRVNIWEHYRIFKYYGHVSCNHDYSSIAGMDTLAVMIEQSDSIYHRYNARRRH